MSRLPYHEFEYDGNRYVLDVERMAATRTDGTMAAIEDGTGEDASTEPVDRPKGRTTVDSIGLLVTQTCNLNCGYCYGRAGEYGQSGAMDEDTAIRAIDWLAERSGQTRRPRVRLFGGEPLMNLPVIKRVVEHAKAKRAESGKDFRFLLTTNGTLLDDEMVAFLAANAIKVVVSFDGPRDVQDVNRPFRNGQGSHEVVAANVARLLSAMPPHLVFCRATLHGSTDPNRVRKAIEDLGFAHCKIAEAAPSGHRGQAGPRDPAPLMMHWEAEVIELLDAVKARDAATVIAMNQTSPVARMLIALAAGRREHFHCGAGRSYLAISVSGDIFPCHRFVGLADHRMGSIWGGELDATQYCQCLVTTTPECAECWARYLCGGGCIYDHLARSGAIAKPDPVSCRQMRFAAELAIHVHCELSQPDRAYVAQVGMGRREPFWQAWKTPL